MSAILIEFVVEVSCLWKDCCVFTKGRSLLRAYLYGSFPLPFPALSTSGATARPFRTLFRIVPESIPGTNVVTSHFGLRNIKVDQNRRIAFAKFLDEGNSPRQIQGVLA